MPKKKAKLSLSKTHPKLAKEAFGWELLELRGPMDGYLASDWETAILKMLRSNKVQMGPAKSDLNKKAITKSIGFIGTEMWVKNSFPVQSIKELMRLTEEFEENKK